MSKHGLNPSKGLTSAQDDGLWTCIADQSRPQYPTRTIKCWVNDRGCASRTGVARNIRPGPSKDEWTIADGNRGQTQSAISVQGVGDVDSPSRPGIADQSSPRYSIRNYVQGSRPLRTRLVRNMHPNDTFLPILVACTYSFRQNPRSFSFSLKTLPPFLKVWIFLII